VSSIQEIYGVPQGSFPTSDFEVKEIEVEPDTSRNEEIACKLFGDLNKDLHGIPGDGVLVILSVFEEDEESTVVVPTKVPQDTVVATVEEDHVSSDPFLRNPHGQAE
jgi:hypothetical protein